MRCSAVGCIMTLTLSFLAAPLAAHAQQAGKAARIGVLCPITCTDPHLEVFRHALRELGYVEGRNLAFVFRAAEGKIARLADLAAELVRLNVDVLFTSWGTAAALAAKQVTTTLPIVMGAVGDPVASGLVANLARPGGNITGLSSLTLDLEGKRLELLKDLLPTLSRVAVLWDPTNPYSALALERTQQTAQHLGVQLHPVRVHEANDFESAFATLTRERPDALIVHGYIVLVQHRARLVDFAAQHRLRTMYSLREFVEAGGLMSYGVHLPEVYRRAAAHVDKILKGTKPADIPVEQPTKFELIINLKAARALGLTI
ncbi:MAG: ABC transporter substrate-binding protein, partial [Candidatus Entotheonellia bacterium]